QVMVRTETLPFHSYALATPGQLCWVYLNQLVDYDERLRRIHIHCIPKFQRELCEVCHEPVIAVQDLPEEIRDKVYRPAENEAYNVEVDLKPPDQFEGMLEIEEESSEDN